MIKANTHIYTVSAMYRVLQVNRSTYYHEARQEQDESVLVSNITDIFKSSRNNYGIREPGIELYDRTVQTSER